MGATGGAGEVPESAIRSENNFGTSSQVPGTPSGGGSDDDDRGSQAGAGKGSGGGSGGSASGGGEANDELSYVPPTAAETVSGDGPSEDVVFPLLAVLLAVGAAIGVIGGVRSRGRRG